VAWPRLLSSPTLPSDTETHELEEGQDRGAAANTSVVGAGADTCVMVATAAAGEALPSDTEPCEAEIAYLQEAVDVSGNVSGDVSGDVSNDARGDVSGDSNTGPDSATEVVIVADGCGGSSFTAGASEWLGVHSQAAEPAVQADSQPALPPSAALAMHEPASQDSSSSSSGSSDPFLCVCEQEG
jgi:hypothetical protein